MEDALTRLHRAIDYALLATVSGNPQQRRALYGRFASSLSIQGAFNSVDTILELPNFEALLTVLPVTQRDADGQRSLHPIWESPDFIAPAVAAMAVLFDRTLDVRGDSRLSLRVTPQAGALYGYRLDSLEAEAFDTGPGGARIARPMEAEDWSHVSVVLCGAALAWFKEPNIMRFAPRYLRAQAERDGPEGGETPQPFGRRPFVSKAWSTV